VAREAGARSKIAVHADDPKIDPVGACVGHRGGRVQAVVGELFDEKIDIIRWSDNVAQFVAESLSPAKVSTVEVNEDKKSCFVLVPDNQLSLAIGKSGQNVRLAARLTGWRIDIRSEAQAAREMFEGGGAKASPKGASAEPAKDQVAASADPQGDLISYDEDVTITADMLKGLDDED
jgi:N utilization substance protein A